MAMAGDKTPPKTVFTHRKGEMIMKKLLSVALCAAMLALTAGCSQKEASSQAPADAESGKLKIGLIQLAEHPSLDEIRTAFTDELAALGYGEDKVEIDYQNAQNDMNNINAICQKFAGDESDMIVAIATPAAQGAASVTTEIPIVFSAVTDPIAAGLVSDLQKPDSNITGTSDAISVEGIFGLADELTPGIETYGLVYNLGEDNSVSVIADAKAYLDAKNIAYREATVTNVSEVTQAMTSLVGKVDAVFCPIDNTVANAMPNLAQIAIEAKLPVYVAADSMVADGGLATVGVNYTNLGKQTAKIAAEILGGKPVSEVPVEVLDEYATVVNPETAAAIGVDVSQYVK